MFVGIAQSYVGWLRCQHSRLLTQGHQNVRISVRSGSRLAGLCVRKSHPGLDLGLEAAVELLHADDATVRPAGIGDVSVHVGGQYCLVVHGQGSEDVGEKTYSHVADQSFNSCCRIRHLVYSSRKYEYLLKLEFGSSPVSAYTSRNCLVQHAHFRSLILVG